MQGKKSVVTSTNQWKCEGHSFWPCLSWMIVCFIFDSRYWQVNLIISLVAFYTLRMNGTIWHIQYFFNIDIFYSLYGKHGWRGVWVVCQGKEKKWRGKRCCGRVHMFISQGPLPHKTLYTIPIYRSSEQQQCRSHSLCQCLSLSPFYCTSLSPSRSLVILGYLIIRQFLSLATYCSRVLGLPDYRVSLESPKVCMRVCVCDSVFDFKKGTGLYSKSLGDNYLQFAVTVPQ